MLIEVAPTLSAKGMPVWPGVAVTVSIYKKSFLLVDTCSILVIIILFLTSVCGLNSKMVVSVLCLVLSWRVTNYH